jgi:ATP-dependent RNA helicase RhlE
VPKHLKPALLVHLLRDPKMDMVLVFSRMKHSADRVARILCQARVPAEAIHGNKSQNNRVRALNNFKDGATRILVATDIAARGIDIDGVTHVINFELPNVPESYVHRIGRTARAGREGTAISLCDSEERAYLADIERLIKKKVPVATLDFKVPTDLPRTSRPQAERLSPHSAERSPRAERTPRQAPRRNDSRREGPRQDGHPQRSGGHASRSGAQQARTSGHAPRTSGQQTRAGGNASRSGGNPQRPHQKSEVRPYGQGPKRSEDGRSPRSSAKSQGQGQNQFRDSPSPNTRNARAEKRTDTRPKKDNRPWWKKLVSRKE